MTSWKFQLTSRDAWDAMYKDCRKAKRSIDLEQFIIANDSAGSRFFDLFKRLVSRGVKVRIICDMVGSYGFYTSNTARELILSGMEILFFNPIKAWRVHNFSSWFFRNHRKLLVIDSKIGYTGGVNICAEYASWRDTHVRITGSIVGRMKEEFDKMWLGVIKNDFRGGNGRLEFQDKFAFSVNTPHVSRKYFYRVFLDAVKNGRRFIYLTTPYFVPPIRLFRALLRAARRGVDVRLLVPLTSNFKPVDIASFSLFGTALKAGMRIYRYKGPLIHAKTAVIDGGWATVGSANLDNQSFVFNHEANLISTNFIFADELKNHFLKDLEKSVELKKEEWEKRSLSQRMLEIITWPIHWVL